RVIRIGGVIGNRAVDQRVLVGARRVVGGVRCIVHPGDRDRHRGGVAVDFAVVRLVLERNGGALARIQAVVVAGRVEAERAVGVEGQPRGRSAHDAEGWLVL